MVPATDDAEGHTDTEWPAEVIWGPVARTEARSEAWDREVGTCTVYCHGVATWGGTNTVPAWVSTDGTAVACDSCHGDPPVAPHVPATDCERCHGPMTPETHIDGEVTFHTDTSTGATGKGTTTGPTTSLPCNFCHGSATSDAPPPDLAGSSDTTEPGVGAHEIHITGGATSVPVACEDCHIVPAGVYDAGHLDASPAEVTQGGQAAQRGVVPTYDSATNSCTNYCHGADLDGGTLTSPVWTVVDGTQNACGSCHSLPPGGFHPPDPMCDDCHAPLSNTTHINGVADF
jgi:hypothetical protein